jgi:hypothetical protein
MNGYLKDSYRYLFEGSIPAFAYRRRKKYWWFVQRNLDGVPTDSRKRDTPNKKVLIFIPYLGLHWKKSTNFTCTI